MKPSPRSSCVLVLWAVLNGSVSNATLAGEDTQDVPSEVPPPVCSIEQLARLSPCELDCLYRQATADAIPLGFLRGIARPPAGKPASRLRQGIINGVWLGKEFRADQTLINHWCGLKAIKANVYIGSSWVDGQPAIVMDYRGSSLVWANIRDEMRPVAPGVYLGFMFRQRHCREPKFRMHFMLEPLGPCCACPGIEPAPATSEEDATHAGPATGVK